MDAIEYWLLPHGIGATDLAERLKGTFQPAAVVDQRQRIALYDTFAWQLWHEGVVLCQWDETFALCPIERLARDEAIVVCEDVDGRPRFWWDWPAGRLRETLRRLIGVRALSPIAEVHLVTQRIDLRNTDDKTVARVVVQHYERPDDSGEHVIGMCRVVPVRGYDRDYAEVQGVLEAWGFPLGATPPVEMILAQSARRPTTWSSKPAVRIAPEMTVRDAVGQLATASLAICRQCEQGIIDDIDTEFLHDYRVSLRRLQSMLKLLKHVYPAAVTEEVLADLTQCARRTNRLRDLDVYLLKREEYLDATPAHLRGALEKMFEDLQRKRIAEQHAVAAHLESDAYRTSMARLLHVFDEDKWWPVTLHSHASVLDMANRVLPKRYEKIRRQHAALTPDSPDERIHDVRLQAKKLRYLLEFFGGLYWPQHAGQLVAHLKKLQNTLGEFNDLALQQESSRAYVEQKTPDTEHVELVLAIGSLLGILHRQHQEVRRQVFRRLAAFTGGKTLVLVQELFVEERRAA